MTPHFHDVYDHVLRDIEWTERLRDLVTTMVETNPTIQGDRLNIITEKGNLLCGGHRRTDRDHRFPRPEPALPVTAAPSCHPAEEPVS